MVRNENRAKTPLNKQLNSTFLIEYKQLHTVSFPMGGNGLRSGGSFVSLSAQQRSLRFLLSQMTLFINLIALLLWGLDLGNGPTSRVNSLDHSQVL